LRAGYQSFGGETSGSVAKCRLFSQATTLPPSKPKVTEFHDVSFKLGDQLIKSAYKWMLQNVKINQIHFNTFGGGFIFWGTERIVIKCG